MKSQMRARKVLTFAGAATALALAAVSLVGCSSSASKTPTLTSMTLAAPNGPNNLNPALNGNGTPLIWYTQLDYAPLIDRTADGKAEPDLATSWHYSSDRLSFVLNLRKNVKFADGEKFTAAAVVNSLEYTKKNTLFPYLSNVKTITASGPLQVTITLTKPDPLLPFGFDQEGESGDIIAPAGLKNPKLLSTQSFGAGEYILDTKATITNSAYVYKANPNYWDKKAIHFKTFTIKVIADDNSTLAALRSGQIQAAQINSTTATAGKAAGLNLETGNSAFVGIYFADIDGKILPAMANVKVRQALEMAIDRKSITKALYGTTATPTDQYAAPGTPGYVASLETEYAYNPTKAKQLLASAGYPNGFSFPLLVQPGALNQNQMAQAVVQDWKAIGVNVTLTAPTAFPDYVSALEAGKYPATTYNFYYSNHLTVMQGQFTNPGLYNFLGYTDVKSNKYANQERLYDVGTAKSNAVATTYEKYVVDQAFAAPVSSADTLMLTSKKISNVGFQAAFPIPDPTKWTPAN
jgi:peptide/nickel transport system substrate-binding protein